MSEKTVEMIADEIWAENSQQPLPLNKNRMILAYAAALRAERQRADELDLLAKEYSDSAKKLQAEYLALEARVRELEAENERLKHYQEIFKEEVQANIEKHLRREDALEAGLRNLLEAVRFTGWSVDDPRWTFPIKNAESLLSAPPASIQTPGPGVEGLVKASEELVEWVELCRENVLKKSGITFPEGIKPCEALKSALAEFKGRGSQELENKLLEPCRFCGSRTCCSVLAQGGKAEVPGSWFYAALKDYERGLLPLYDLCQLVISRTQPPAGPRGDA